MDKSTESVLLSEDSENPYVDAQESYRIPTRRLESYRPYTGRHMLLGDTEAEAFIPSTDDQPNTSKLFSRTLYPSSLLHGRSSIFQYVPVFFVFFLIGTIYGVFFSYHLKPNIRQDISHYGIISDKMMIEVITSHVMLTMFALSYLLCMFVNPGTIPNTAEWSINEDKSVNIISTVYETKKSGARRVCKWCSKYKPDRTHHCRVCGTCTLKMDHHCPWVNNCIGWRNHKYFYLSVLYSSLLCIYIAILSYPSVKRALSNTMAPFAELLLLIIGEVLSIFFGITITCFLLFHTWLMCEAFTTIEFCEKRTYGRMFLEYSIWSNGIYNNIQCVLGKNPLLWLIPIDNREGNGITFITTSEQYKEFYDDNDHAIYDENSTFIKMARETIQFDPIINGDNV